MNEYLKDKSIMMVGSVPCATAEDTFRLLGPVIGNRLAGLSHGEPGYRNMWVVFNAPHVFEPNPDIIITNKPKPDRDKSVFKEDIPDWLPTSWEEMWRCKVVDHVEEIHFDTIHYADFAIECYKTFKELRDQGVIPAGTRYQVNFPFPEDFTRWCTGSSRDFHIMTNAIVDVLAREVQSLVEAIPHEDLSVQWDVCWEVFACDTGDYMGREPLAWKAEGDPYDRFAEYIARLSPLVPEDIPLGMHLCYGDLEHSHLIEPKDLGVVVKMANLAVTNAGRRFDYIQMPVPGNRSDDDYFAPLKDLDIGTTKLYIGLVHLTDGVDGTLKRLETFRRHYNGAYGVATECGWGRRQADTIKPLMDLHRQVTDNL
jgi:hypothetical protein